MLPPPPVQSSEPPEPQPQAESPSSVSSGYSSIPPTSAPDFPFLLPEPEPSSLEDLLTSELTFNEQTESRPGMSDLMRSQVAGENSDLSDLAKLGLLHEERLLCKDKVRRLSPEWLTLVSLWHKIAGSSNTRILQLKLVTNILTFCLQEVSQLTAQVRRQQAELERLRRELAGHVESNKQMMGIVEEFEMTIQQLIREKERTTVVAEIERERAMTERNQIFEDLQAVERAFTDLHRKYERTKEVIAGFKSNEDVLKVRN